MVSSLTWPHSGHVSIDSKIISVTLLALPCVLLVLAGWRWPGFPLIDNIGMRMASAVSRFLRGAAIALWLCCGSSMAADGLLWFGGGRPGPQARQAVELLAAAATHGLEPQDYNASALLQAVTDAAQGSPPEPATIARLEQALTTAMQRYLADLHVGRIDPRLIHHDFNPPRD